MANRITSIRSSDVLDTNRFEPKMYLFQLKLRKAKEKYQFVVLGNEKIATDIKRGQSPKPETYKDKNSGKYIFIRTADVKKYQANTESAVYLDEKTFATQKSNRIAAGDILISVVGNYLGSTCVIPDNIEIGSFNDNSAKIKIVDKNISPYYVSAFLNSVFGQNLILSLATRTGQKIISAGNVKKLCLPLIDDNKDIVHKYEKAIALETKSNTLISKAQKFFYDKIGIDFKAIAKESTFTANTRDFVNADLWIPMYSYPLYVNTLKAISDKWQTVNVGAITDLKKGKEVGSDNYIGYLDKRETDVPFIRTSDIVNYGIDQYTDFYAPLEFYNDFNQGFQKDDVLFSKDGKIGMVGMITQNDKAIISSGFAGLRLNKKAKEYGITPEYLFLTLSIKEIGIYASKRRTVVASTIPHLREERLKEIEIPILDKNVIVEITNLVKEAFQLKDEKKRLIAEVRKTMDGYFEF